MNERKNKRTNERMNWRKNKRTNERMNKRTNKRMYECKKKKEQTNKQTNKQTNEKMNEQTNKWTNERTKEHASRSFLSQKNQSNNFFLFCLESYFYLSGNHSLIIVFFICQSESGESWLKKLQMDNNILQELFSSVKSIKIWLLWKPLRLNVHHRWTWPK